MPLLVKDNRVDFIAKADYSAGSELEDIVKEIITNIVASEKLISRHEASLILRNQRGFLSLNSNQTGGKI